MRLELEWNILPSAVPWGRSEKRVEDDPAVGVLMDKEGWPGTLSSNLQLALGAKEAPSANIHPSWISSKWHCLALTCLNGPFDCKRI